MPEDRENPADLDIGVIYTYEDQFMEPLLSSLARSGDGISMRLILVDNASKSSAHPWKSVIPRTTVVRNGQRLGYAANLNRILEHASAPYVLLMNSDIHFDPEEQCLAKMVQFMNRTPDCGVAGCRLYHADHSYAFPARRFQTLKTIAARRLGLTGADDVLARYFYQDRDHNESFECDWLSGCFLLVRRCAVEKIGRLDVSFKKYFEDVDLCLRLALAGWKVMCNGETYCYHLEQRGSRRLLSRDAWLHLMSYIRWLRKWGFAPDRRLGGEHASRRVA